ncbi:clp protease regulatory subunit clpx1 [Quercus suber]|uniref:Clp protease regulatory subunit clpx1 n=1 Tax=Quercus suber TaxID=58331 RepID=A0AAW0KQT8_QUESU
MELSSSSKSKSKKPHSKHFNSPDQLSSKTPEKQPTQLPRNRPNSSSARRQIQSWPTSPETHKSKKPLPEKYELLFWFIRYEILAQFFDSLDSSIRLLRLKGSSSSFTNICPKIECLTDRRFTHRHLAQLKFILRDAIEIKRVLVFDERTSCMKPDLHVSINVDAVENDGKLKSESGNMQLRKVLRSRLVDFSKSCPEVDEIPEELLPEPFNRKELDVHSNMKAPTSSFPIKTSTVALTALQSGVSETCIQDDEIEEGTEQDLNSNINNSPNMSFPLGTSIEAHRKQQPVVASHLSRSFHKRFSQKVISHEVQNYPLNLSKTDLQSSVLPVPESPLNKSSSKEKSSSAAGTPSPSKLLFESTSNEKCLAVHASPAHFPQSCPPATPSKEIDAMNNENGSPAEIANIHLTPAKHVLTPAGLMNVTPTLYPPKRCYMSPEDDSTSSPNKLIRRPPCSKSLKFDTPIKNGNIGDEMDDTGCVSVDNDVFDILPENILQSIIEKERKAVEERNPAISWAKWRRQMIASLPKLFNMIHFLFQSIKRSVITKEELIHKIIASHCDIVDRREVEEQLNLLIELVPEWISEKLASGGDLLFCINKMSRPESLRARLEEAKRQDSSIGFGAPVRANTRAGGVTDASVASSLLETVESSDLISYGLIPEFVGQFPILASLSALTENQLVQVLTEPKNALGKQYKKMFQMNGIPDIRTGDDIIDAVVVDEEAVGSEGRGSGAKILYGKGALDRYLSQQKVKDLETTAEGSDVEPEVDIESPSIVASMFLK